MTKTSAYYVVQTFMGEMWEGEYLAGQWKDLTIYNRRAEAERNIAKRTRGCDPTAVALRWRIDERQVEL